MYYAVLLLIERYVFKNKFQSHIITMILVIIGWIFFRADGLRAALSYLKSFTVFQMPFAGRTWVYYILNFKLEWIFGLLFISPYIGKKISKRPVLKRVLLILLFMLSIVRLMTDGFNPFIYFRF